MKNIYIKTTWVDNKTPVNAANLNKLENAVYDLYNNALSPSDIVEGNGIKLDITENKKLQISTTSDIMASTSCQGVEVVNVEPSEFSEGVLYFVVNPETGKLRKIVFNSVVINEME